jgi:hypothetical protein
MRTAICSLLLLAVGNATDNPALRGPSLGLVFDPSSRSVRPVLGLPGAATIGEPLTIPFPLRSAAAAHRGGFVLAQDRTDGGVVEITVSASRKLSGVMAAPDQILFSPSAVTAGLYHQGRRVIEVLRGLPDHPALAASFDLTALPGMPSALAVSDDGLVLAACPTGPDSAAVYVLGKGGPPAPALSLRRAAAVAFLGVSHDALVADAVANLIYRVHDAGGATSIAVIAGVAEGILAPVALASSLDGKQVVVANAGGTSPVVLNLRDGTATSVSCTCQASGVEPMAGNAVFRLTAAWQPQVWLLDAEGPKPRALFVPSYRAPLRRLHRETGDQ